MVTKKEIRQAVPLNTALENLTFTMQGESFTYLQNGRKDEAVNRIKEAWSLLPEPKFNTSCSDSILRQLIETLAQVGRYGEARPILDQWIDDIENCGYPVFETTPFILSAENHLYAKEFEKAKAAFYRAMKYGATKRAFSDRRSFYFDIAVKRITDHCQIAALFEAEISTGKGPNVQNQELSGDVIDRIEQQSEQGNEYFEQGEYDRALELWQQALSLIPHPQQIYAESQWLETSIGDVYFLLDKFELALACFQNARSNIEANAYENPFILLRLGQCFLENKQLEEAKEYLLRAYMLDGEDIFENDDEKYFAFLKENVRIE